MIPTDYVKSFAQENGNGKAGSEYAGPRFPIHFFTLYLSVIFYYDVVYVYIAAL